MSTNSFITSYIVVGQFILTAAAHIVPNMKLVTGIYCHRRQNVPTFPYILSPHNVKPFKEVNKRERERDKERERERERER